ncbi:DUF3052 domain-containing protein [Corynebacterium sp. NML180780]|nr:DUF3052 domain-containing protein [Corynebacterium sp. NML180780]
MFPPTLLGFLFLPLRGGSCLSTPPFPLSPITPITTDVSSIALSFITKHGGNKTLGAAGVNTYADRLGIHADDIVQEIGWDEDADSSISEAIEDAVGEQLLDESTDELCDVVLLWFRSDDGDLVDALMDAIRNLGDSGRVWLMTPGASKPGGVHPGEISESAQLAGLMQTKADRFGEWQGSCLTPAGTKK